MKTEKTLAAIAFLGLILKFAQLPGSGVLLLVSFGGVAMVCFPGAVYFFSEKEIKQQNIALSIVGGFFLALVPIGILFKVMYWPGAAVNLLVGLVASHVVLVIVYVQRAKAEIDLDRYYRSMLFRTLFWCVLAYLFYFTPTASLIQLQHSDDPELARLKIQHFAHPENEEYSLQYNAYMLKKDSILIEKALE